MTVQISRQEVEQGKADAEKPLALVDEAKMLADGDPALSHGLIPSGLRLSH